MTLTKKYLLYSLTICFFHLNFHAKGQDVITSTSIDQSVIINKFQTGATIWDFSITQDNAIWVCSEYGEIFHLKNNDRKWKKSVIKVSSRDETKHINFFNDKTGIIYGFLKKKSKNKDQDYIYRTTNFGRTWKKTYLPIGESSMWVNTSLLNNDGTGFLCSTHYIYFTNDFGKTWKIIHQINKSGFDDSPCEIVKDSHIYYITCMMHCLKSASNDFKDIQTLFSTDSLFINNSFFISDFLLHNDSIYVLSNNLLYSSGKTTLSWKKCSEKMFTGITSDKEYIYVLGVDSLMYKINKNMELTLFNNNVAIERPYLMKSSEGIIYSLGRRTLTIIKESNWKH